MGVFPRRGTAGGLCRAATAYPHTRHTTRPLTRRRTTRNTARRAVPRRYYYKRAYYSDDDRASECQGVFYGGDGGALGAACLFVLFLVAWVGAAANLLFAALACTIGVRCSPEEEEAGMDDSKHGGAVAGLELGKIGP